MHLSVIFAALALSAVVQAQDSGKLLPHPDAFDLRHGNHHGTPSRRSGRGGSPSGTSQGPDSRFRNGASAIITGAKELTTVPFTDSCITCCPSFCLNLFQRTATSHPGILGQQRNRGGTGGRGGQGNQNQSPGQGRGQNNNTDGNTGGDRQASLTLDSSQIQSNLANDGQDVSAESRHLSRWD